MTKVLLLTLLSILLNFSAIAQLSENSWRDHLSYNSGRIVAVSSDKVYCATDLSVFYLDKDDYSLNHLTPIEGLSEIGVSYIAYADELHLLVVVYTSGNIDLVDDNNQVINMSGLKDADFTTDKRTNHINIVGTMAYLSCNFGITAINLEKREFADTYILGENGNYQKINCSAVYGDYLYAFTPHGMMRGRLDNQFLTDIKNWEVLSQFDANHNYNTGCVFNNKLLVDEFYDDDYTCRVSTFDGECCDMLWDSLPNVKSLTTRKGLLVRTTNWNVDIFDEKFEATNQCSDYEIEMGVADDVHNVWFAHASRGLGRCSWWGEQFFTPSGPGKNQFFSITYNNGEMLLAPGGKDRITAVNSWQVINLYRFVDNKWIAMDNTDFQNGGDISSFITHGSRNHFLASSWSYGLIEYNNGNYNWLIHKSNDTIIQDSNKVIRITSGYYDNNGNLWVNCSNTDNYIAVRTPSGKWYSYAYESQLSGLHLGKMLHTYKGDFWLTTPGKTGILVFNTNNTPETNTDDSYDYFMPINENGEYLNSYINDIVEDNEGKLWIASDAGVYVYDNPEYVLEGKPFYGRQPQMVIDGYYQTLLGTEKVNSIVIDGGNRKWFGTAGGGIFVISADGTTQYAEYNTTNSPIFSNNVLSMSLDYDKGILYIITDKGLQSAAISSSIPKKSYSDVFAFPNPVEPSFNGDVQIRGLMNNTVVRITDLYGNLVFETMSSGGGASWNLRNMSGQPVVSGIYLVQCVTDDGEKHEAEKIHVVR